MTLFYGITFAFSLLMLGVCFRVDRKRDPWLLLLFLFVTICNAGYLILSLSRTLTTALIANSVAYLGNVFLPFFVLRMVIHLSHMQCPKWLSRSLIAVNTVVFLIATSGGYASIYNKEVSLAIVDGAARLVKVYGPLHGLYKLFLLGYFGVLIAIILYTAIKKTAVSTKHTTFLAIIVFGNIALWLVENITCANFEFLTISYLMTEALILLLYGILQDHEDARPACTFCELAYTDIDLHDAADECAEGSVADLRSIFSETQIQTALASWPAVRTLSQREKEVLRFILEKRKRKDIAQVLFVTESTIKKHTSNIYKKLEVANRAELFEKVKDYIAN